MLRFITAVLSGSFFDKSLVVTAPNVPSICHHHQTGDKPPLHCLNSEIEKKNSQTL